MLLTIVTISRWNDATLDRTLKSVDNILSTFADQMLFEQIVVISEEGNYEQHSYRKFVHLPPKGIYNAMNHGLSQANGEWIWFLNAGDECAEGIISIISILKRTKGDIVSAGIYTKNENTSSVQYGRLTSPHPGTFYKTQLLKSHGGYREDYKVIADRLVFDELRPKSTIERLKEISAIFYEDGISSSKEGLILRRKETFKYFKEKPYDLLRFYRLIREIIA